MAITFSCRHCGKSLTTSDDKAGRKAKCPGCGEVLTVPEAEPDESPDDDDGDWDEGELPAAPPPVRKKSSRSDTGSKTCPMCGAENSRRASKCDACGEEFDEEEKPRKSSRNFEVGDVISSSWAIYKRELGIVVGSIFVAGIVSGIAGAPAQVINTINDMQQRQGQNPEPVMVIAGLLLMIPGYLAAWFLQIGVTKVLLQVARGEETTIGDIFSGGRYFLRMLGSTLLFIFMIIAGLIACVVPGFLVLLMFWPYVYSLVDEDPGGVGCLWRAKEISQGNWGAAFVLSLAACGINLLGFMACCVGIIFTAPLTQLMFAVAYCRMTGQRTSE